MKSKAGEENERLVTELLTLKDESELAGKDRESDQPVQPVPSVVSNDELDALTAKTKGASLIKEEQM